MDAHNPDTSVVIEGAVASVKLGGAAGQLKSIVERIERINEEIAGLQDDVRDIYKESKGNGFDVPAIRMTVAERKKAGPGRANQLEMFRMYLDAAR